MKGYIMKNIIIEKKKKIGKRLKKKYKIKQREYTQMTQKFVENLEKIEILN